MISLDFLPPPDSTAPRVVRSNLRFHLDEDRIRDFLMGENLYGDPALALREAYQNAVDACRLADARRSLLRLPEPTAPAESFNIEFEQGVDADGRAFIDCIDHGAGMGIDELSLAFCQAGVRASDLADRAEELGDFAASDPPVELWLNSRFGIGVMSYFMLADAVSVATARLNRDGSVGRLLTIDISGPASSFDVVDRGPASAHGSRIRLWLKSSVSISVVSTLRDLIFVCPFSLRVSDGNGLEHRWMPHALNSASKLTRVAARPVEGIPGLLWWVPNNGLALADGIWANRWMRGTIVNLNGSRAPKLTADRSRIVKLDHDAIEMLGVSAVDSAVEKAWDVVGEARWLSTETIHHHKLTDAIVERAMSRDLPITLSHGAVSLSIAGYMPGDGEIRALPLSESAAAWRFSRLVAAGYFSGVGMPSRSSLAVVPARPSDALLLGALAFNRRRGEDLEISRWFPRATSLYEAERHLEYPLAAIIARARELDLQLPDNVDDMPESNAVVRTALSFSKRENNDGTFRPLGLFDIVQTSWHHRITQHEVRVELELRAIEIDCSCSRGEYELRPNQLVAASTNVDGIAPWLSPTEPIGLDHVVNVARATHSTASEVVAWMHELGYTDLPTFTLGDIEPTSDDIRMLSSDLDGVVPFIDSRQAVNRRHLYKAAKKLALTEAELEPRFKAFGVAFTDDGSITPTENLHRSELFKLLKLSGDRRKVLRSRHRELMSRDGDSLAPWLNPARPIRAWMVAAHALRQKRSLDEVLADYEWLGYEVEDPRTAPLVLTPGQTPTGE